MLIAKHLCGSTSACNHKHHRRYRVMDLHRSQTPTFPRPHCPLHVSPCRWRTMQRWTACRYKEKAMAPQAQSTHNWTSGGKRCPPAQSRSVHTMAVPSFPMPLNTIAERAYLCRCRGSIHPGGHSASVAWDIRCAQAQDAADSPTRALLDLCVFLPGSRSLPSRTSCASLLCDRSRRSHTILHPVLCPEIQQVPKVALPTPPLVHSSSPREQCVFSLLRPLGTYFS